MLELVQRVNWDEYFFILSQGNPSIGLQLLVVNATLAAYWIFRRTRKRKSQQRNLTQGYGWTLQALFVAANVGVVALGSRLSF